MPPKEENDKRYEQSQEQRRMERELRYAKRDAAMADAMDDPEAFDRAALRVQRKTADYQAFIDSTGRTPRLDRTATLGYTKDVEGKVNERAGPFVTKDGLTVRKTDHSISRSEKRGISDAQMLHAIQNPLTITPVKYDGGGRPSVTYIGEAATVAVNPTNGNITTVHGTHNKLAAKLKGGKP